MTTTEALQVVIRRRGERLEDIFDEYEEEPVFAGLRESSQGLVVGSGSVMARVMFIGFAPGRQEDDEGLPFVGPSGEVLNDLLSTIGLNRHQVYLTNVLKYRAENDDDAQRGSQINVSMKYLRREVAVIKPWVIVPLGADVLRQFEPSKRLSACHGTIISKKDRSVVPMYHPASVLREPQKRSVLLDDIASVRRALEAFTP